MYQQFKANTITDKKKLLIDKMFLLISLTICQRQKNTNNSLIIVFIIHQFCLIGTSSSYFSVPLQRTTDLSLCIACIYNTVRLLSRQAATTDSSNMVSNIDR